MILFKRKRHPMPGIDMAPFVDMVFTLLIFFIITATFVRSAVGLKLPVLASGGSAPVVTRTVVSVDTEQQIMVNGQNVRLGQLGAVLGRASQKDSVLFQCDERVPYGFIVKIMQSLRSAGVKDIALMHTVNSELDR